MGKQDARVGPKAAASCKDPQANKRSSATANPPSLAQELKHVDHQLQAMVNRISFLKCEEAKIDRDIVNARKRTQELLHRKVEKTQQDDVIKSVHDVLALQDKQPKTSGAASLRSLIMATQVNVVSPNSCIDQGSDAALDTASQPAAASDVPEHRIAQDHLATNSIIPTASVAEPELPSTSQLIDPPAPGRSGSFRTHNPQRVLPGDLSPMGARKASRQLSGGASRMQPSSTQPKLSQYQQPPGTQSLPTTSQQACCTASGTTQGSAASPAEETLARGDSSAPDALIASATACTPASGLVMLSAGMQAAHSTSAHSRSQPYKVDVASGLTLLDPPAAASPSFNKHTATGGVVRKAGAVPSGGPNRMTCLTAEVPQVSIAASDSQTSLPSFTEQELLNEIQDELDKPASQDGTLVQLVGSHQNGVVEGSQHDDAVTGSLTGACDHGDPKVILAAGVGWGLGPRGAGMTAVQTQVCQAPPAPASSITKSHARPWSSNRSSTSGIQDTRQALRQGNQSSSRAGSATSSRHSSARQVETQRPSSSISSATSRASASGLTSQQSTSSKMVTRQGDVAQGSKPGGAGERLNMALKQQLWHMRRVFGLEPAVMKDNSARIEEARAGAW